MNVLPILDPELLEQIAAACFEADTPTVTWLEAKAAYTEEDEGFDANGFEEDHAYYYRAARAALTVFILKDTEHA